MKAITIGCSHFGLVYKGINFNDRIHKCFEQIFDYAQKVKPDIIIFLGDIFHNMGYSMDAMVLVIQWLHNFDSLGCRIEVVQGNHDKKKFSNDEKDVFDLLEVLKFDNIMIRRGRLSFYAVKKEKLAFIFIPYLDKSDLPEEYSNVQKYIDDMAELVLEKLKSKWQGYKAYVFSHLSVEGAKTGSEIEFISSSDISVPKCLIKSQAVKKIFNGHIHLKQEVGKVVMPGSIESFRFGEGSERFFLDIEL